MKPALTIFALLFTALSSAAPPTEQPAIDTVKTAPAPTAVNGIGTTVVGEQEAAIGLTITPWKEEAANDLDRPPLLFDEPAELIDVQRFRRQAMYQDAAVSQRRERLQRFR